MVDDSLIRIETPEHVVFEYELAGPGSRMVAALVDAMLVGLGLLTILILVWAATSGDVLFTGPWAIAVGAVAAFALLFGYPIFFEIWWKGQTPGKRSVGLRVIQEGGYALSPSVVIVRNLLRVVDFLPGAYVLGLTVMILHPRSCRIGDLVAGTLVIRERASAAARPPEFVRRAPLAPAGSEDVVAELRRAGVHALPLERVRLIEDFLGRRGSMTPEARRRLARELAAGLGMSLPPMDPERLLQCVLAARHTDETAAGGGA
jgi:uncharacterized RDD family membrane protein YckC